MVVNPLLAVIISLLSRNANEIANLGVFKQEFKRIDTFAFFNVFVVELKQLEKISKALADFTRLKILSDMSSKKGCIQCSEIMKITNLAQPSISHHVKTLLEAGLIEVEKDGRNQIGPSLGQKHQPERG